MVVGKARDIPEKRPLFDPETLVRPLLRRGLSSQIQVAVVGGKLLKAASLRRYTLQIISVDEVTLSKFTRLQDPKSPLGTVFGEAQVRAQST